MLKRVFLSAAGGVAVTTGLLFLMQLLIANGEEIIVEERAVNILGIGTVREEKDIDEMTPPPAPPVEPVQPPTMEVPLPTAESGAGIYVPIQPPAPPGGGTGVTGISNGDGPLVNIIRVSPTYPVQASAKGLEGSVLVQYDVTTEGSVVNVVVVESSHRLFERAAIAAAYRFKYKPRTVDGIPYESKGLRNLFRFEMED